MGRLGAVLALGWLLAATAFAQAEWRAVEIDGSGLPPQIVPETRAAAPSSIPYMLTTVNPVENGRPDRIVRAWYGEPTSRYRHGVLGDAIEGGALVAELSDGQRLIHRLDEALVFEDIAPRIADLDGDGRAEIVTIIAHQGQGAAVAIFAVEDGRLAMKARNAFIGRANRWLNIAAVAPLAGGGTPEIAIVTTPHIGGRLAILRYAGGAITRLATADGFSNHVIGSPELRLSATADVDGDGLPDLALPSADRRSLRIVGFGPDGLVDKARIDLPARIDKAIAVAGARRATVFTIGLEDGRVFEARR